MCAHMNGIVSFKFNSSIPYSTRLNQLKKISLPQIFFLALAAQKGVVGDPIVVDAAAAAVVAGDAATIAVVERIRSPANYPPSAVAVVAAFVAVAAAGFAAAVHAFFAVAGAEAVAVVASAVAVGDVVVHHWYL